MLMCLNAVAVRMHQVQHEPHPPSTTHRPSQVGVSRTDSLLVFSILCRGGRRTSRNPSVLQHVGGTPSVAGPSTSTTTQPGRRTSHVNWYRRPSYASGSNYLYAAGGSVSGRHAHPVLENTYRLEPDNDERFRPCFVEPVIRQILQSYLDGEAYEARKCANMCKQLSEVIRDRVKSMRLPRYKLLCTVVIGQKSDQALRTASRSLWNASFDGFASASYENSSLFATATVYAVYYD